MDSVNEHNVLVEYKEHMAPWGLEAKETGLWINTNFPGLGASPDGLLFDPSQTPPFGVLEIKCPHILRDFKPIELDKLSAQQRSGFSCTLTGDNLCLKKTINTTIKFNYRWL